MQRLEQLVLIVSTLLGSWLGMQAIHEAGHVLAARLTGGDVVQVVFHPLTISRTELAENPQPLVVVWAGPLFGVLAPLLAWTLAVAARARWSFLLRFFAGFCLLANGTYIGIGSFEQIGDCREMLQHGSARWQLWLFGALTAPLGLWLWHRQGPYFGLGQPQGKVHRGAVYGSLLACVTLVAVGLLYGGE